MLVDVAGSRHVAMHHGREFEALAALILMPIFSKPPTSTCKATTEDHKPTAK